MEFIARLFSGLREGLDIDFLGGVKYLDKLGCFSKRLLIKGGIGLEGINPKFI